jgi:peptidoglycan-associated lipoprotein
MVTCYQVEYLDKFERSRSGRLIDNNLEEDMKTALRITFAILIALTLAACQSTKPKPTTDTTPEVKPAPTVDTMAAPDPRDYADERNFDNPESLLSRRVIYFDFDRSTVLPEYRGIVSAHAAYAQAHSSARITLEGHADERGTREYNLGLAERRGNAIEALMAAQGARSNQLTVVSYGEERPTCRVSDDECWSLNRRVEIIYTAK